MTSSSINDIPGISYFGNPKGQKAGFRGEDELSGMFQNAMNLAKDNSAANMADEQKSKDTSFSKTKSFSASKTVVNNKVTYGIDNTKSEAVSKDSSVNDAPKNDASKDINASKSDNKIDDKTTDDIKDKATELEDKVVKEVADKLDVSEEDVKKAMEELGLSFADLSDQANMAMLVTELIADGDSMAMLTDENLMAQVVDLTQDIADLIQTDVADLSEELGIPYEDIMDVLTEEIDVAVDAAIEVASDNVSEDTDMRSKENVVALTEVDEQDDAKADDSNIKISVTTEKTEETTTSIDNNQSEAAGEQAGQDMNSDASAFVNPINVQTEQMAEGVSETEVYQSGVDTQDIIDQIAEHVRVNTGSDFSEIEIALNPASLGNIHLQVEAKEGVITATITTENETVRDALLVQAMILKEELNEQGLKVEAVDVTVASHEFEQNMQGESGEEAKQLYEQQVQKQTRRRIMIDGLQDAEELLGDGSLSDAERLQIDMMAKSGNSMDVMA